MKSVAYFIIGLIAGAAGGAIVAKFIIDGKTEEKIAKATIEARDFYKEEYEKKVKKIDEKTEKIANDMIASAYRPKEDFDKFGRIFGKKYDEPTETNNPNANKAYLYMIDPDEAGMDDSYTQYPLDYFQDGTLVDDQGNVVEDALGLVGDYLDDLSLENPEIFVRNDVTRTEYDICYVSAAYEQPGGLYD